MWGGQGAGGWGDFFVHFYKKGFQANGNERKQLLFL
jgi:hypothetical protein